MNIRQISNWSIVGLVLIVAYIFISYEPPKTPPQVAWENYSLQVGFRINAFTRKGDCKSLLKEFNSAYANYRSQKSQAGIENSDLMRFIRFNSEKIGCYGDGPY